MMVSPDFFRDDNKDKTLKELISIKNKLIVAITDCENILTNKKAMSKEIFPKPGPKVIYEMNILYLKEILDLIINKKDEF